MSESRAALRYAKAILDMAKENKALDAVEKDMTEMELKKLVGDYIVSRAKDTGSITVPMVNAETATTKIV